MPGMCIEDFKNGLANQTANGQFLTVLHPQWKMSLYLRGTAIIVYRLTGPHLLPGQFFICSEILHNPSGERAQTDRSSHRRGGVTPVGSSTVRSYDHTCFRILQ